MRERDARFSLAFAIQDDEIIQFPVRNRAVELSSFVGVYLQTTARTALKT